MTDILSKLVQMLYADEKLMKILKPDKEKGHMRIYKRRAPFEEEIPRVVLYEISADPVAWYDNRPTQLDSEVQISIFSDKQAMLAPILDRVIVKCAENDWRIFIKPDIYEDDTGLYHKPVRITKNIKI